VVRLVALIRVNSCAFAVEPYLPSSAVDRAESLRDSKRLDRLN
jgi:hypothetical protein